MLSNSYSPCIMERVAKVEPQPELLPQVVLMNINWNGKKNVL